MRYRKRKLLYLLMSIALLFSLMDIHLTPGKATPSVLETTPIWSEYYTFSNDIDAHASPSIAIDDYGTLHVVWRSNTNDILYCNSTTNGSWLEPISISNTIPGTARHPAIAISAEGSIHVVWVTDGYIWHAYNLDEQTWQVAEASTVGTTSMHPDINIDHNGMIHLVWQEGDEFDGPAYDIYYKSKRISETWSGTITSNLSNTPNDRSTEPSLFVEDSGQVHVVWQQEHDGISDIYYRSKPLFETWNEIEDVSSGISGDHCDPSLVLGDDGTAHVAWADNSNSIIYYRLKYSDHQWTNDNKAIEVSSSSVFQMQKPDIAIDKQGAIHLVWQESHLDHGDDDEIYYCNKPLNLDSWIPQPINLTKDLAGECASTSIATGSIHIVWRNTDIGLVAIKASAYAPNQPINVTPANERAVSDLTPTLTSSIFADADRSDSHLSSQWQVTTTPGDYSNPVWETYEDNKGLTTVEVPADLLSNQTTYYWRIRHRDSSPGLHWSTYSEETSFLVDVDQPTVTINSPIPNPTNDNTPMLTGSATDATSDIYSIEYRIDNTHWLSIESIADANSSRTKTYSITTDSLSDGIHIIEVIAIDEAGNTSSTYASQNFTIDTMPPSIISSNLDASSSNTNPPIFSGMIRDETSTIVSVEYSIDGSPWETASITIDPNDPKTAHYRFRPTVSSGDHTIRIRATDDSGNVLNESDYYTSQFNVPPDSMYKWIVVIAILVGIATATPAIYLLVVRRLRRPKPFW
ncbi:MAG: Ig-like domain-containing protein [Chloroflexota bacterium]|nr:Ig-like domain-containing protein [Chloroflexota bacterium]